MAMLSKNFFDRDAVDLAKALLGKVLRVNYQGSWLAAQIIETESYFLTDRASHASLGFTEKRKALFMPPATIYMYYARGGDSLNVSARGEGNAVLIKSAIPYADPATDPKMIEIMQRLNPYGKSSRLRSIEKLCAGQTLLCRSLGLKVPIWNQKTFDKNKFFIDDIGHIPAIIIKTMRLGIPLGRDHELLYRFIDYQYARYCTSNPCAKRNWQLNRDYFLVERK